MFEISPGIRMPFVVEGPVFFNLQHTKLYQGNCTDKWWWVYSTLYDKKFITFTTFDFPFIDNSFCSVRSFVWLFWSSMSYSDRCCWALHWYSSIALTSAPVSGSALIWISFTISGTVFSNPYVLLTFFLFSLRFWFHMCYRLGHKFFIRDVLLTVHIGLCLSLYSMSSLIQMAPTWFFITRYISSPTRSTDGCKVIVSFANIAFLIVTKPPLEVSLKSAVWTHLILKHSVIVSWKSLWSVTVTSPSGLFNFGHLIIVWIDSRVSLIWREISSICPVSVRNSYADTFLYQWLIFICVDQMF